MSTLRWLTVAALLAVGSCQESDNAKIETRAIDGSENALDSNGGKFKVYVGTIDGVRRELFNEVDGGEPNFAGDNNGVVFDPFGTYDDNLIISTENEKNLFVPKPYRPGNDKKEQKKTTTTPRPTLPPVHTTIRTVPPLISLATRAPFIQPVVPQQPQFNRPPQPLATAPPQPVRTQPTPAPVTFAPQTFAPRTFPPQVFQTQPPRQFQTQPPRQFQTQPPRQFQTQPPQPVQNRFTQAPFRPRPPQQPFTFAPQVRPEPLPEVIRPQFTNRQPFQPQQPQFNTPRPVPFQPATTPAAQLPFANTQNLRSGQCPASIFYISTPISGPTRLTFTHFAIAVTVDQCARTCHEFNCAIAHYNPVNGHCEFNPSTAFAIRNGQCPAWPSLHYRNNVVASEPVRIFCVQCQRPRRRPNRQRNNGGNQLRQRAFDDQRQRQRGIFKGSNGRSAKRSFDHPIIHGVLVKQPQAIALGTVQQQFIQAIDLSKESAVGVDVAAKEVEENNDGEIQKSRAEGVSTASRERVSEGLVKELEKLQ